LLSADHGADSHKLLRGPSRQYPQYWFDQGFFASDKEVSRERVECCGPFENHKQSRLEKRDSKNVFS